MAQLGKLLLRQCPILQNHYRYVCVSLHSFPNSLSPSLFRRSFSSTTVARAAANSSSRRRIRSPTNSPKESDLRNEVTNEEDDKGIESEAEAWKSRNDMKREAQRAVRWGMDLASFTVPQIKRILSVASLEKEVFEAIILVKKLGSDVKEGKRRQYNLIGKLLRKVDPELMDTLVRATRDGDHSTLQSLATAVGDGEEDYEETDSDDEDGGPHFDMATRWLNGLIEKDIETTNEVYSIRDVEFDRQELRKLVRKVQSAQEKYENADEENKKQAESAASRATQSLTRYLRSIAKELQIEM